MQRCMAQASSIRIKHMPAAARRPWARCRLPTRGVVLHKLGEPQEEPLPQGHARHRAEEHGAGPLRHPPDVVPGLQVGPHNSLQQRAREEGHSAATAGVAAAGRTSRLGKA